MTAWQNWKASVDIRSRRGWFRIWLLAATGWGIFAALHVDWPWQIKPETVASHTVRHGQKPADVLAQVQSEAALVCQPGSATINRALEPEQPGSSNDPVVDQTIQKLQEEQARRFGLSLTAARAQNPDQAAQANILSRKTGIPADTVRRNLPQVQQDQVGRDNIKAMDGAPDYTKQWFTPQDNTDAARHVTPQVMVETISASCFPLDKKEGVMAWALVVVLGLPVAVPLALLLIGYVLFTIGNWIWLGFRAQPDSPDLSIASQADSAALEPAAPVDDRGLLRLKKALRWSTVAAMAGDIMLRNALTSAHASGTNILFFAIISSATFFGCKSYGKRHHADLMVLGMTIFWVLAVVVMLLAAAPFM
jgi:FtsH-binding integral membrane protein